MGGSLTHHALPAFRQLADVLTRFLPSWPGFVRGWVPMFLNHDFLDVSEYSASREAAPSVVVPVSAEVFFEDVQGSNLHQCPECKQRFSTIVGMFLHRTRVHSYKSPQNVHFKGRTCPRCKSVFATEKSANDHYRRNLKRKFCTRPRGPDASPCSYKKSCGRVRPRTEEREDKGSLRSKRFLESLDSRLREIEGRNAAWLVPAEAQALVVPMEQAANHYQSQNPGKGKPHPMGPRRVILAAGLLNALSVINLTKADQQQQIIIERQDKLLAIVNKPSIARQKEMLGQMLTLNTTPEQLLTEIAACVWFKTKKTEKYLLSLTIHTWSPLHQVWDYIHTALLCAGAKQLDGPPPRGPQVRAL